MANQINSPHYKQAPLPFVGQKRMFLKHFSQVLSDNIPNDGEGWTIVDTFGGSGLLSHTAKRLKPKARVIYNDYDGYSERLAHIEDINRLRRLLIAEVGEISRETRIPYEIKQKIIHIIRCFDGYIDLQTLQTWLLFSGNQAKSVEDLLTRSFFNCIRQSDYPGADGYLDGVEVVCLEFDILMQQFEDNNKAIFVLDPPYICTSQINYRNKRYFDLIDFLRLTHLIRPPYVFFSSTKSEFVRFVDYVVDNRKDNWSAFINAKKLTIDATVNKSISYEDNLLYKF